MKKNYKDIFIVLTVLIIVFSIITYIVTNTPISLFIYLGVSTPFFIYVLGVAYKDNNKIMFIVFCFSLLINLSYLVGYMR